MSKAKPSRALNLFLRADKEFDRGRFRSAFRHFRASAEAGEENAFLNVGCCYDTGKGTHPNRSLALHWYRRAYRRGDACAATNIGTIWRDQHQVKRALYWFQRAVKMGDGDANLEIAKIYLCSDASSKRAVRYLNMTLRADHVTEDSKEQARRLLRNLKRSANPSSRRTNPPRRPK